MDLSRSLQTYVEEKYSMPSPILARKYQDFPFALSKPREDEPGCCHYNDCKEAGKENKDC